MDTGKYQSDYIESVRTGLKRDAQNVKTRYDGLVRAAKSTMTGAPMQDHAVMAILELKKALEHLDQAVLLLETE